MEVEADDDYDFIPGTPPHKKVIPVQFPLIPVWFPVIYLFIYLFIHSFVYLFHRIQKIT